VAPFLARREVLAFSLHAGLVAATVLAGEVRPLAIIAGLAGIFCSARIYIVPARPAWNSWLTMPEFFLTALVIAGEPAGVLAQTMLLVLNLMLMKRSDEFELRQSAATGWPGLRAWNKFLDTSRTST
jgi:DMSO reductase anchor subunit